MPYSNDPLVQVQAASSDGGALALNFAFIGGNHDAYLLVPEFEALAELKVDIIWSMVINFGINFKLNSTIKYACDGEKNEKTIANKAIEVGYNNKKLILTSKYSTSIVPYIPQGLDPIEVAPGQLLNINGNRIRHSGIPGTQGNFLYIFKPITRECPGCGGTGKVTVQITNPRTKEKEDKEINCRICKGNPEANKTTLEPTLLNILLSSSIVEEDQGDDSLFAYKDNKIIWNTKTLNTLLKDEIKDKIAETLKSLNDINQKRTDEGKCPCCIKSFNTTFDVKFDPINGTNIRTPGDGANRGSSIAPNERDPKNPGVNLGRDKFPPPVQPGRPQPGNAR